MPCMVTVDEFASPIGPLTIGERSGRVCLLHFGPDGADVDRYLQRWYPDERVRRPLDSIRHVLREYFAGDCRVLDGVAVELNGTPFQRRVWEALRGIPAGSTESYADLARRIGEPRAVRAVGAANGANPVAVIVPCHRVIGTNGTLTGYGGGLDRKQWLLAHEGVLPRLPL
jgi:methylated-DNA-[protein]-cysteine S-methyltransferase